MQAFLDRLKSKLQHEGERVRIQFLSVFSILGVVSLFMTLINYLTGYMSLMYTTLAFAICCIIDFLMTYFSNNMYQIAKILFAVEIVTVFTSFAISGEPEGFSLYWLVLLPAVSMLLYGTKYGTILTTVQLLIIIYLFWFPTGRTLLHYHYNSSTMLRFPALYVASYILGFLFENIRGYTQEKLEISREKFRELSYTDALTRLGNEAAYIKLVSELEEQIKLGKADFSVIVMDVNALKHTDDTYGHNYGCKLIVETGQRLPKIFENSKLFHIGGDEFVAIVPSSASKNLEAALAKFNEQLDFDYVTYKGVNLILSVAIGYATYQKGQKYGDVFQKADDNMYKNKQAQKKKYNLADR